MKTLLLLLLLCQDPFRPIYGPGHSLIGFALGYAPATVYFLDSTGQKYIVPHDRELLKNPSKLKYYLSVSCKLQDYVVSDSVVKMKQGRVTW